MRGGTKEQRRRRVGRNQRVHGVKGGAKATRLGEPSPPPLCLLRTMVAGAARAAGSAQDHRFPAEDLRGGSKRGGCPDPSD